MKKHVLYIIAIFFAAQTQIALAADGHNHSSHDHSKNRQMESTASDDHNVGNTICPVSHEEIGSMGDGDQIEYNGKIYNLCCSMCAKDFKKDPEKYVKIISENQNKEHAGAGHGDHDH